MFGTSKWETCYPQTFEHRPALPTDPIEPIESAPSSFVRNQRVVRPLGELCIPKNKRMTHIIICVVRFYLPEMTIFLPLKTLYRQKEVKRGE